MRLTVALQGNPKIAQQRRMTPSRASPQSEGSEGESASQSGMEPLREVMGSENLQEVQGHSASDSPQAGQREGSATGQGKLGVNLGPAARPPASRRGPSCNLSFCISTTGWEGFGRGDL